MDNSTGLQENKGLRVLEDGDRVKALSRYLVYGRRCASDEWQRLSVGVC
jgi:hypothetical protein